MHLTWETSHAVFVAELDGDHQEIFAALSALAAALESPAHDYTAHLQRLGDAIEDHFAHEERLMRAARYQSYRWHKSLHDSARKRVGRFVREVLKHDAAAGHNLVDYLGDWLHYHTRLPDTMLGAFLRNQRRLGKLVLRAGTKPAGACEWVDASGNKFDPAATIGGS
jgi:hemerythrin